MRFHNDPNGIFLILMLPETLGNPNIQGRQCYKFLNRKPVDLTELKFYVVLKYGKISLNYQII